MNLASYQIIIEKLENNVYSCKYLKEVSGILKKNNQNIDDNKYYNKEEKDFYKSLTYNLLRDHGLDKHFKAIKLIKKIKEHVDTNFRKSN